MSSTQKFSATFTTGHIECQNLKDDEKNLPYNQGLVTTIMEKPPAIIPRSKRKPVEKLARSHEIVHAKPLLLYSERTVLGPKREVIQFFANKDANLRPSQIKFLFYLNKLAQV